jgi:hypothetical protein
MAHWVEREARRANRNLLIVNAVILVITILIFVGNKDNINLSENFILIAIGAGFLLLCGWNCIKALRRNSEIQTTPLWKQASIYGDVEQVASQMDQELQMEKTKYKSLLVTRSWMIRKSMFGVWVSPLNDLAWAYKKVTKHYTNFIPTGKTYAVVIVGRHRQRIEVQLSQKNTDQLLGDLARRVPWAIFGYSKEIAGTWQKDPGGFVATVDSRQQQFKSKSATGAN